MKNTILVASALLILIAGSSSAQTKIGKHEINETPEQWAKIEGVAPNMEPPPSPEISPHALGEPFNQWLRINGIDLLKGCGLRFDCSRFYEIDSTGKGEVWTKTDPKGKSTFGFRFSKKHLTAYTTDKGATWHTWESAFEKLSDHLIQGSTKDSEGNRSYSWRFYDGHLAVVTVTALYAPFSEEVKMLSAVYGAPAEIKESPYQNAYGATWKRAEAAWRQPDGTTIDALESTAFNTPDKLSSVTFRCEALIGTAKKLPQQNPYAK